MTLPMPAEQMERYKRTARTRWQIERERRVVRRECAWQLARRAATLLKDKFGVHHAMVFGSPPWSLVRLHTLIVLLYGLM
jgi:hypothetical protein